MLRNIHTVRYHVHRVAAADPAQPTCIRRTNADGRGETAHRASGEARRNTDLAQRPIALTQIAVGQEPAPELQRIAVDHIDDGARQIAAPEPQSLCAGPHQRTIEVSLADRAIQRGA